MSPAAGPINGWAVVNVRMKNGSALRGIARNQGKHDIQLQSLDGRMHLLQGTDYIEVTTSEADVAARALYERFGFINRERGADGPLMYVYEREL